MPSSSSTAYYRPLESGVATTRRSLYKLFNDRRVFLLSLLGVGWAALSVLLIVGPEESMSKSSEFITYTISQLSTTTSACPAHCPSDPFVKSGFLYLGPYANDTRWLHFPHDSIDALEHPIHSEMIDYVAPPDPEVFAEACPQYMKMLSENSTEMPWARNRTVLYIGSSHDRYFCSEVHGHYTSIGGHKFGYCTVPSYNLTIVNWFLYGMVDSEDDADWWQPGEEKPITFERRFEDVMLPLMRQEGLGRPDLIIETSLFWDDSFLDGRAHHYNGTRPYRGFTYSEINWHRSRVHSLVARTRQLYGRDVPIMFRTRHMRKDNWGAREWRIFQLDQSVRAISEELGIKLYLWGDKLEGQTEMFYDGDQHFKNGPATWLAWDMTLFYLHRAITPGCWHCHQWRD